MSAFETLFMFYGRIDRARYFKALLAISLVLLAVEIVFRWLVPAIGMTVHPAVRTVFGLAIEIPCAIAILAIVVKRLHDLNFNGWWVLILAVPALIGYLGWDLVKENFTDAFGYAWRTAIDRALVPALYIVGVIVLGLIPGTRGPNRYDPPRTEAPQL